MTTDTPRGIDPEEEAPLTSVEDYLTRVLSSVRPLDARNVPLAEAHGCVPVADVIAPFDLPTFRSSAMDGFAVRSTDVALAPARLRISGEVRMGHATTIEVEPGDAVAVPTGGIVPDGADAVVPIELCSVEGGEIVVLRPLPAGKHVRPAGEDVCAGDALVPAGRRLRAPDVGALAAAGIAEVTVRPRPRVGIVSTGDELVRPPVGLREAQVYDANAYTLMAAVREAGGDPVDGGTVPDDPRALVRALDDVVDEVDVLVCSGGVSMGVHDPVKRAFARGFGELPTGRMDGGEVAFFNVAMQPGRPQAFGTWRERPFFGLPGNPVSVFVSFEVFVRPALSKMAGRPRSDERPVVDAVLDGELEAPGTRTRFARVRVRHDGVRFVAAPEGGHRSNLLATFARADGLAVIPAGHRYGPGDTCRVTMIREVP